MSPTFTRRVFGVLAAGASVVAATTASAQVLSVTEDLPGQFVTVQGQQYPLERVWKPICGPSRPSPEQFINSVDIAIALAPPPPVGGVVPRGTTAFDLTFNVSGTLPAGAQTALNQVEAYIESVLGADQMSFPIICDITFSDLGGFDNEGRITLGSAGSAQISTPYATIRDLLRADADADDRLPSLLPNGSTIPVDFGSGATTRSSIDVNLATFAVTDPNSSSTFSSVSITFNNNPAFDWDFDPSNGISGTDFQSVVAHEIVHGLGFVSGIDNGRDEMSTLDLFRFRTSANPSTHAAFAADARYMARNAGGEHNVDFLEVEWPMEDGDPNQGSHLLNAAPNTALMDPLLDGTLWPNFLRQADLDALDAIGLDLSGGPTIAADEIDIRVIQGASSTVWEANDRIVPADASGLIGIVTNIVNVAGDQVAIQLINAGPPTSDSNRYRWVFENLDVLPDGLVVRGVNTIFNDLSGLLTTSFTDDSITIELPIGFDLIGLFGALSRQGVFQIVYGPPAPPNNLCTSAIPLACGDAMLGTNVDADNDGLGGCITSASTSGQVWYSVVGTGADMIATTDNPGTNYDTKIWVWESGCGAPVCVTGNDDGGLGLTSRATWASTYGDTYYVQVGGFSDREGDFELSVECPAPPNDDCASAIAVPAGCTTDGTIVAATLDGSMSCGISGGPDVWYSYTAPMSAGVLTVDTFGTNAAGSMDTVLSLHSGCPGGTGNELACNDDAGGLDSQITYATSPGESLLIRVTSYDASDFRRGDGNFILNTDFQLDEDCNANLTCDVAELAMPTAASLPGTNARLVAQPAIGMPSSAFTVEMWFRSTGVAETLFSYGVAGSTNEILIIRDAATLLLWVNSGAVDTGLPFGELTSNAWHHVAFSWRSVTGQVNLYVDGRSAFTGTLAQGGAIGDGGCLVIGEEQDSLCGLFDPTQAFVGDVRQVRLWGVERSSCEIAGDYDRPLTGSEPGLVSYWPMDEGSGTTAFDAAGTNNLNMINAGWTDVDANGNGFLDECPSPACPCDYNEDGLANVTDLLAYLSDWFPVLSAADYNNDGTTNVTDLLAFLSCWFPANEGSCPE